MPSSTRSPRGAARREEILTTALRVLARDGHRGTSMRAIGRELGIEPAHILYYFSSRENLLQEVVRRWDDQARESLEFGFEPEHALDSYVEGVKANTTSPGLTSVYLTSMTEATDPEHAAHIFFRERFARVHGILRTAIEHEQRTGNIAAGVDAGRAARKLAALSDGLQLQAMFDASIDVPGELGAAIRALRAPGAIA